MNARDRDGEQSSDGDGDRASDGEGRRASDGDERSSSSGRRRPGIARAWLAELRSDRRTRWFALAAGVAVGLAAAQVHWYGFVLGGALVGLVSKTAARGLLAGVGFGLLSWIAFAGSLAASGSFVAYAGMGQVAALSVASPVGLAALGSLVRGVA